MFVQSELVHTNHRCRMIRIVIQTLFRKLIPCEQGLTKAVRQEVISLNVTDIKKVGAVLRKTTTDFIHFQFRLTHICMFNLYYVQPTMQRMLLAGGFTLMRFILCSVTHSSINAGSVISQKGSLETTFSRVVTEIRT